MAMSWRCFETREAVVRSFWGQYERMSDWSSVGMEASMARGAEGRGKVRESSFRKQEEQVLQISIKRKSCARV